MAYYLGRDLEVAITTENANYGVGVLKSSSAFTATCLDFTSGGSGSSTNFDSSSHSDTLFAGPKKQTSSSVFGTMSATTGAGSGETWSNTPDNLTAVDLSVSTMDEDVQFIGQRNVLKAEIKKENSITLTRKKSDNVYNAVFDDARFGIVEAGDSLSDGHTQPDFTGYGYRVYLRMNDNTDTGEQFILPNCCITDYTVTLQTDGSQEESITLMSYVTPVILSGANGTGQIADATGGV